MEKFYDHVISHHKLTLSRNFQPPGLCLYKIIVKINSELVDGKSTSR